VQQTQPWKTVAVVLGMVAEAVAQSVAAVPQAQLVAQDLPV
jgi:hypothetical protein